MAQEQPIQVNAALAKWLAAKAPDAWSASSNGSSGKRGEHLLDPRNLSPDLLRRVTAEAAEASTKHFSLAGLHKSDACLIT
jgi:hypothetical protein